jgi:transposase
MDSKMMKMKKGNYEQAYNCQLLVEDKNEIIVGNNLSNSQVDVTETEPTMENFKQNQKVSLKDVEVFQDNGYSSVKTAEYYEKEGAIPYIPDKVTTKELHGKAKEISKFDFDNFELDFEKNQAICPAGHRMDFIRIQTDKKTGKWTNIYRTDECNNCEFKNECCEKRKKFACREANINPLMRTIRLRFKTKEGKEKYNKRFHKGEIAQAHIEYNLGYREFKCRGINPCENEVNLFSIAYNLIKIHNKLKERGRNLEDIRKNIFSVEISFYFVRIITQPVKGKV